MRRRQTNNRWPASPPGSSARPVAHSKQAAGSASPRILLYSHDSWGLGHLRRNLTIATALTEAYPGANTLIVTGSPCATHFSHPARVSIVKLPSVTKDENGDYHPRSFNGNLESVLRLRGGLLREVFSTFDPHLLIVDHQIIGLHGEALPILEEARRRGVKTLLGLRDIIDSPAAVESQWSSPPCRWALEEAYDRICVYGGAEVYDPRREYAPLAKVADRVELTGYVVRPPAEARPASEKPASENPASEKPASKKPASKQTEPKGVLVTMGGGQDGVERVRAYLDALALGPVNWKSTIVTGPLMTADEVKRVRKVARSLGSVKVHRFHPDMPHLLERAELVVSMAGYNSAAEILQSGRPAIFLPRTFPRREQAIRATRLARLGLARVLLEPRPITLRRLVMDTLTDKPLPTARPSLSGTDRLCDIAGELLGVSKKRDDRRLSRWQHALPIS